jgi:hypothetical protein
MRMDRMLMTLVVGSACLFGALGYAGDAPKPDGTVSVWIRPSFHRRSKCTWPHSRPPDSAGYMQDMP